MSVICLAKVLKCVVNILKSISVKKILMGGSINKDIDKITNAPAH